MKKSVILAILSFSFLVAFSQWEYQVSEVFKTLSAIQFINEDIGWAAGHVGSLVYTNNGGESWQKLWGGSSGGDHVYFHTLCFKDVNIGFIAGHSRSTTNPVLTAKWDMSTTDGGNNWNMPTGWGIYSNNGSGWIDACLVDNVGWKLLNIGSIFKSTNDSLSDWTLSGSFPCRVNATHFTDSDFGWVAGDGGYLFKTTNGGNDWTQIPTNTNLRLVDVYFINNTIGFISGWNFYTEASEFLKTTDGGQTWYIPNYTDSVRYISKVTFVNSTIGFACGSKYLYNNSSGGYRGVVLYTDDAGENWTEQNHNDQFGLTTCFRDIYFISESTGWVAGEYGDIYKTTNAGGTISYIDEQEEMMHVKCFPNPFTTSTTFEYNLDKPATVTISIFNPQGQLIEKIEQEQPKGEQQVQWNAEGLPAGMYYYRIQAGEMVGGGKMVKTE